MELKLYNRLKQELLGDFVEAAESNNPEYQRRVAAYAPRVETGLPRPQARLIQGWVDRYNRLARAPVQLRYYQILALYFTEHVLASKRRRGEYLNQKALVYWMATGSGKTLLMHLNILQYIDHIGGLSAFDELQIVLTTPGVNLIVQHERELRPLIESLNRACNNRIKLTIASTAALLNKEPGYFKLPPHHRIHRLVLVDEGHIGLAGGANGTSMGAFKQLREDLLQPDNAFLFEYSATYHGIADKHVREYEEQIVYDYNYYRFFRDGYGKDYAIQKRGDDRFAAAGWEQREYFDTCFDTLADKLGVFHELRVSQARGSGEVPFTGQFPDKPLLAFMGNTVEDPKSEGQGDKDEVSDIRKILAYLARLDAKDKQRLAAVFNHQTAGRLTLTRCPGVQEEIWLSWGDGEYWGIINVGNGDKFFADSDEHPSLMDDGEMQVNLRKAPIVHARYHFEAIDGGASPINVLIGSRKFAEGWNCFRLSVIGLVNLGKSKGNKIIQIYGRGVRLKGLRGDGKRRFTEHNEDYSLLIRRDTPEYRLRRLETLNVFSLKRNYLQTFLDALERDMPITRQVSIEARPAVVHVGSGKERSFDEYRDKLSIFKLGDSATRDWDTPMQVSHDPASGQWHWRHCQNGSPESGTMPGFELAFDYRPDGQTASSEIQAELRSMLEAPDKRVFLPLFELQREITRWCLNSELQLYWGDGEQARRPTTLDLVNLVNRITYHQPLNERDLSSATAILEQLVFDVLDRIRHKVIYDICKRDYRYGEPLRQATGGAKGDFLDRYTVTCEFESNDDLAAFNRGYQADPTQLKLDIEEDRGQYHIYEPLLVPAVDAVRQRHKLKALRISPDKLNEGERKFLRDILAYLDQPQFANSPAEYYLMRNIESLRSIGLYLEDETRVFCPDFILWKVDDKAKRTDIIFFDPKGETGIIDRNSMQQNQKVTVATSGHLAELANKLKARHKRQFSVNSFILLRDSSQYGKTKTQTPTQNEIERIEEMQRHHVLRLDWHSHNENGDQIDRLIDGRSYLDMAFDVM